MRRPVTLPRLAFLKMPYKPSRTLIYLSTNVALAASALMACILTGLASLSATTVADINDSYQIEIWNAQDDLSNRTINAISQDARGYLWLATRGGLIRFDGRDFLERQLPNHYRPRGNNIRSIAHTRDGEIVIQPTSAEILTVTPHGLSLHPTSQEVSGLVPHKIFGAGDGALWISVRNGDVLRWTPHSTRWFHGAPGTDPHPHPRPSSFAEDSQGNVWISTQSLAGIFDGEQLLPLPAEIDSPITFATDTQDNLYILQASSLLRYRNGKVDTLSEDVPWAQAPEQLSRASLDAYDSLWIAAGRFGLLLWDQERFHPAPSEFPVVNDVFRDQQGKIWVASEGNGFGKIQRRASFLLNRSSGLAEEVSTSLHIDQEGTLWVANANGGLYRIEDRQATYHQIDYEGQPLPVNVLSFDPSHTLWIGNTSGLFRVEPPYTQAEKLPQITGEVHLLHCAQNGDLWCATTFGKYGGSTEPATFGFFRDGQAHLLTSDDGYNGRSVMTIEEGPDGQIWAGSYDGDLYHFQNEKITGETFDSSVTNLHNDSEGNLWIATLEGLLLRRGSETINLNRTLGYKIPYASSILEDENGHIWYGLYHFPKYELLKAVDNQGPAPMPEFAGGLGRQLDISFLVNWHPTSLVAPQGRLCFATSRGILVYDPTVAPNQPSRPQLYLDSLKVNGRPLPPNEEAIVPPGQHQLEATFSVPHFSDQRNVGVRYRLLGAGDTWIDARNTRSLTYSALAPGDYELQIEASGTQGWKSQVLSVPIHVLPAWWQTLWFRILGGLLALALTGIAVKRWSQRRLREQVLQLEKDQALERERARIARDLHDDLGGGLSALQLLAARIARKADNPASPELKRLSERAGRLNADVHSIVWLFTPGDGTLRDLAELVRRYATELFKSTEIQLQLSPSTQLPPRPLEANAQHNLFFAAKEALTNVLKHAQARRLTIDFSFAEDTFHCLIADDGCGLPPTALSHPTGNGLSNIKTRIEEIGGQIQFQNAAQGGTTLSIKYPLRKLPLRQGPVTH